MATAEPLETKPLQAWRILVVEDDPGIREEMVLLLEGAGYTPEAVADGAAALARLGQEPRPDLIVLDLVMPRMDGWQLRAAQLASATLAAIPVLAMSGEHSAQARAIHAEAYLSKPFGPGEFLNAVERAILRAECRRLQVQLTDSERLVVLGTIAAELGHEINNPLTYILHNLAELEAGLTARPPEELQTLLHQTREGADRIHDIVLSLGQMSRRGEVDRGAVELALVLETAIAMTAHHFEGRARIQRAFQAMPSVWGNPTRLGQLFINLLSNAAQSIDPDPAERGEVVVRTSVRDGMAEVEISDTGSGIPPEVQSRLFEPFFTTKPAGQGTGLGLPICRNIVREHGGRLELESDPGSGTTVRILLPIAEAHLGYH